MRLFPDISASDLASLSPEFQDKIESLILGLRTEGILLVAFSTRRGPAKQAEMWCQSRSIWEVQTRAELIGKAGAPKIAALLKPSLACSGHQITRNLPGLSWHQWGEAADLVIYGQGDDKLLWYSGLYYRFVGPAATKIGLESGAMWSILREPHHVQLGKGRSLFEDPEKLSWPEVEDRLLRTYEDWT